MPQFGDIRSIQSILQDDGLVGIRAEGYEALFCDARNPLSVARLVRRTQPSGSLTFPLVLLASLQQLKTYIPALHPRIETLLFYHTRPLTIRARDWVDLPDALADEKGRIAFQLSLSSGFTPLIEAVGGPLALLEHSGQAETAWQADHWIQHGHFTGQPFREEVEIEYTREGKLVFL